MHPSTEASPETSQASNINLFARIVKVFKLRLLTIFVKSTIMDVLRALIRPLALPVLIVQNGQTNSNNDELPTICLSVFDHFLGLALKGLI